MCASGVLILPPFILCRHTAPGWRGCHGDAELSRLCYLGSRRCLLHFVFSLGFYPADVHAILYLHLVLLILLLILFLLVLLLLLLLLFFTAAWFEQMGVDEHFPKATLVDDTTTHPLPGENETEYIYSWCCIIGLKRKLALSAWSEAECFTISLTSSSRWGPGRRKQASDWILGWAPCLILHLTSCCSWETELEKHWRWCCGHLNLVSGTKRDILYVVGITGVFHEDKKTIPSTSLSYIEQNWPKRYKTKFRTHCFF